MKVYKITKDDCTDFYTGKVKYEVGKTLIHPNPDKSSQLCSRGFHVSPSPLAAVGYNRPGRLFECKVEKEHILAQNSTKFRVSQLLVVKELNKHLVYGPNWKKVVKKIERATNKDAFYKATKPCPKKMLNEVLRRFKPYTKATLTAETKSFKSWAAAWDAGRDAARAAAWDAGRDAARAAPDAAAAAPAPASADTSAARRSGVCRG